MRNFKIEIKEAFIKAAESFETYGKLLIELSNRKILPKPKSKFHK